MTIIFKTTAADGETIRKIAERARNLNDTFDPMAVAMDLTACHSNGCPLRLEDLLKARNFDFAHDVSGISKHIDRATGKLGGMFLPRFVAIQ